MSTSMRRARIALVCLCLGALACGSSPQGDAAQEPALSGSPAPERKTYGLRGIVLAVDRASKQLVVDHEAIPGFMEAMKMSYPVRDERLLESLVPGSEISAAVVGRGTDYWLERIVILRQPERTEPQRAP